MGYRMYDLDFNEEQMIQGITNFLIKTVCCFIIKILGDNNVALHTFVSYIGL